MLASTFENLLNRNLPRSPRARELCASLAGHRVAIEVGGVGSVLIRCDGERLVVDRSGAEADVRVRGGPLGLIACARRRESGWGPGVEVSGDAEVTERLRELARLLEPDLEEELAVAIGDVPAHELARFARATLQWSRHAADTAVRNVAEYLAYERGHLVSRPEARQLEKGIESVRDVVERLEARLDSVAGRCADGGRERPQA